jgi:hypothetical protein
MTLSLPKQPAGRDYRPRDHDRQGPSHEGNEKCREYLIFKDFRKRRATLQSADSADAENGVGLRSGRRPQ